MCGMCPVPDACSPSVFADTNRKPEREARLRWQRMSGASRMGCPDAYAVSVRCVVGLFTGRIVEQRQQASRAIPPAPGEAAALFTSDDHSRGKPVTRLARCAIGGNGWLALSRCSVSPGTPAVHGVDYVLGAQPGCDVEAGGRELVACVSRRAMRRNEPCGSQHRGTSRARLGDRSGMKA